MCYILNYTHRAAERRQSDRSMDFHTSRGWDKSKVQSSVVTSILIPVLDLKAHYQTIVGTSYSNTPSSPLKTLSAANSPRGRSPTTSAPSSTTDVLKPDPLLPQLSVGGSSSYSETDGIQNCAPPVKKGVLTIVASVGSIPRDLELNPSLMEFVEQVVRPLHESIFQEVRVGAGSQPEDDDAEEVAKQSTVISDSETRPLSFPVDVCITFQMNPSTVILTCNPHARVKCKIAIPAISFVTSFSLFSPKLYEYSLPGLPNSPSSSSLGPNTSEDITMFNNLNITGCFQAFSLGLFVPQLRSSNSRLQSDNPKDKEAFNLRLEKAFVHLSRKSVYTRSVPVGSDAKSVDDYVWHSKLKVSGKAVLVSL